jgi:uncharacterized protein
MKSKLLKFSLCLLFLTFAISVNAGQAESPSKKYAPYPQRDRGFVTDIAGVLTPQQEDCIESWLNTTKADTKVEIVIVIINSIKDYPGTANSSIESFAAGLFNTYSIGNMPKNDGVLLVAAIEDRTVRIELGACYGYSRNSDSERIIQNVIIPCFKKNNYAGGIMAGARALTLEFAGVRFIPDWVKIVIIAAVIILIPLCISLFRSGKRGWGWICVGLIIALLLAIFRFFKRATEGLSENAEVDGLDDSFSHRSRGGFGGGSSRGGFGGGFTGGDGGFSGGGGASGRW